MNEVSSKEREYNGEIGTAPYWKTILTIAGAGFISAHYNFNVYLTFLMCLAGSFVFQRTEKKVRGVVIVRVVAAFFWTLLMTDPTMRSYLAGH